MDETKVVSSRRRFAARQHATGSETVVAILIAVILVVTVGIIVVRAIMKQGAAPATPRVGQQLPGFALPGLRGDTVRLADYRGKVVLVNLWATWCPPCKAEMPALQRVYDRRRAQGFEIIGVDQAEGPAVVEPFVTERNFTWTFALDLDGQYSRDLQVLGIPTSFLIDQNGKIVYIWSGALTEAALEGQLAALGIGP